MMRRECLRSHVPAVHLHIVLAPVIHANLSPRSRWQQGCVRDQVRALVLHVGVSGLNGAWEECEATCHHATVRVCRLRELESFDYGKKSTLSFTIMACLQIATADAESYITVLCVHCCEIWPLTQTIPD